MRGDCRSDRPYRSPSRRGTYGASLLALALVASVAMANTPSPQPRRVILTADRIIGSGTQRWTAIGHVKMVYGNRVLYADRATYVQRDNTVVATGNVELVSPGLVTHAPKASVHLTQDIGFIFSPRFRLPAIHGHGRARTAAELARGIYRMHTSCFTTCAGGSPAWQIYSEELDLDQNQGVVGTQNTTLDFFGLPVFWIPYFSFPLHRHSGFLTPAFGSSTVNGNYFGIPYYFDIADNLDDTLTPTYYSRRGLLLENQFRYLEPHYRGELQLDLMPHDALTHTTLWALSWQNQLNLGHGWTWSTNYNRVSNTNFLSDFGSSSGLNSNALGGSNAAYVPETTTLSYGNRHIQAGVALNAYQILVSGASPYQQLPHAYIDGYWETAPGGPVFRIDSSFDDFYARSGVTGQRLNLEPTLIWKLSRAWGYLEPEFRLYASRYQLQHVASGSPSDIDRLLPAPSLAGGLNLVRSGSSGRTDLLQPQFKYLYIPTVDQSAIPDFDSSLPILSFPEIFSDNIYDGSDRINGTNQLALGLTNTWFTANGRELWQFSLGQVRFFNRYQINLQGQVVPQSAQSAYFVQGSVNPIPTLSSQFSSEVNPQWQSLDNLNWIFRWSPTKNAVINADYEYIQGQVDQFGVSAAWPIARRFQVFGSYQYGVSTHQPLEQLGGLGYDGGCWKARVYALHQILLNGADSDEVFFQIQLTGLTTVGHAANSLLAQYIPAIGTSF